MFFKILKKSEVAKKRTLFTQYWLYLKVILYQYLSLSPGSNHQITINRYWYKYINTWVTWCVFHLWTFWCALNLFHVKVSNLSSVIPAIHCSHFWGVESWNNTLVPLKHITYKIICHLLVMNLLVLCYIIQTWKHSKWYNMNMIIMMCVCEGLLESAC